MSRIVAANASGIAFGRRQSPAWQVPFTVAWFFAQIVDPAKLQGPSPTWSDGTCSDHPPAEGLWAVEPHLGSGSIGAKWEEILVIELNDAYWLDSKHVPDQAGLLQSTQTIPPLT